VILLATVIGILIVALSYESVVAQQAGKEKPGLYDSNPDHLWNRLYRHLYVRIGPAKREIGYDELEPPLWYETMYLLEGQSHQQAVRLLDEFLSTHGEKLIGDPLKRAVFQRDLWVVFDWLAARSDTHKEQRQELQKRLAEVIRRLALTNAEIRQRQTITNRYWHYRHIRLSINPINLIQLSCPWSYSSRMVHG
jgi:hypothetical protein